MKPMLVLLLLCFGVLLTACGQAASPSPLPTSPPTITPSVTATPFVPPPATPTPTPEPVAALVNGEPLLLATFQAEVARLQQATDLSLEDARQQAMDDLIAQTLLAQAAQQAGYQPDVDARLSDLVAASGGERAFQDWLTTNGYTQVTFRQALARAMAAAWMRDALISEVPDTAEQVHARYIFVYNEEQAQTIWSRWQAGTDFGELVAQFASLEQADLGWFPRGVLRHPQIEEAVFALQPGEVTPPLPADGGFYLVQVLERDPARPLTLETRRLLQQQHLQTWLQARRAQAQIELFVNLSSP